MQPGFLYCKDSKFTISFVNWNAACNISKVFDLNSWISSKENKNYLQIYLILAKAAGEQK